MQAIAEFAMRSRAHAIGISLVAGVLPLLGWLSLVIVALVCLRQGLMAGSMVLLWTMLPFGIQTYIVGDPTVLSLVGVFLMAGLLRRTLSWEMVLMMAVFYSAIAGLLFELVALDKFLSVYSAYLEILEMPAALTATELRIVIANSVMILVAYGMIAMLLLARWCQAGLYNPGGFKKEFHQIRLSPVAGGITLIALIACYSLDDMLGRFLPVLTVPLVIAALGFVHWLMAFRELSTRWIVGFYFTLLLFGQLVYPLLICLGLTDSTLNLRNRLQPTQKD